MMTPVEISEHFLMLDHLREMPAPERAERLARLEAALATNPPEDLARQLRVLLGRYQPPTVLTGQQAIDRRFADCPLQRVPFDYRNSTPRARRRQRRHGPSFTHSCGTGATIRVPHDYWHTCSHEALLDVAKWRTGLPALAVASIEGREVSDQELGFESRHFYNVGVFGDATGTCTCPHDCLWSGSLRDMWIEGGHVVCPGCHDSCPVAE
jgi:hypothetical protein